MTVDKNRRNLLRAATALGLSIGISASNISLAAFDKFLKIDTIEGESKDASHGKWIEAQIKSGRLILRDRSGKTQAARQGTYRLRDGSVVVVRNGMIVSHKKGMGSGAQTGLNSNKSKKALTKEPATLNQNIPQSNNLRGVNPNDLKLKKPDNLITKEPAK